MAYQDWLRTQEYSYDEGRYRHPGICWLLDVPELFDRRAPGNTCLSALTTQRDTGYVPEDCIREPMNDKKGCGGVMRIAPMGLIAYGGDMKELDKEGAQIAAVTHGNSLGYMPAAVVTHIIHSIVYGEKERPLREIAAEARDTAAEIFSEEAQLPVMTEIINRAMELAENGEEDLENIHRLGEGWVAEETLGIALYCALRHEDDFSAGIIAAANHRGDSDSTGAVTGNILGALHGFDAMEEKWKQDLELYDVILEMADDLCDAGRMAERGYRDPVWTRKYIEARRKE
jgi:ADP-ribosylglycohydrolase